jgi:membrane protein
MWEKAKSNLKLTYDILFAAGKEFGNDKVSRMAAAVAYRAMFTTAPLFLLAVTIAGMFLGNTEAEAQISSAIERFAGAALSRALETFLGSVEVTGDTAAVLGLALLLWTSSSLFIELQTDLNDIFHVPDEKIVGVMGFIRKRLLGFLGVVGVGMGLIAVWLVNALWRFLGDELLPPDAENLHFVIGLLAPLVSVVLLPVILGLFFQALTAAKVRWRAIWWGSFLTAVGFLAAAYGVGLYFAWDTDTTAPQVAASIFVILLLAFVLSTVFFYGAEVTKVYHDYLVMGDVIPPALRAARARAPEVVVSEPERSLPLAALFAFLGGLFVGWRRRR